MEVLELTLALFMKFHWRDHTVWINFYEAGCKCNEKHQKNEKKLGHIFQHSVQWKLQMAKSLADLKRVSQLKER